MVAGFIERLSTLLEEKDSILCVGLDPALPGQRAKYSIPLKYLDKRDENEARLAFCLDIIDEVKDFCVAFKPNQQYVAGFTSNDHVRLTRAIREAGSVSILDYKLNDIGDTVESALFHINRWGYDAVTFNPFFGNMGKVVSMAHRYDPEIGIIVLTLTSNPESIRYQKKAVLEGRPLYQAIAQDVKESGADGCVVGATGHVEEDEIRTIRAIIGESKALLVPGVGVQRGDPWKAIRAGGRILLINVGREIIYSVNPRKKAEEYCRIFNEMRGRVHYI